jgi:hypothetical protein
VIGGADRPVTPTKPVFTAATRPTTPLVTVRTARSGPYTVRTVVYWHRNTLCQALVGAAGVAPSRCSTSAPSRYGLGKPFGDETIAGAIRSSRIASVGVRYDDGVVAGAKVVSGVGFPHPVYTARLRGGHFAVDVYGYDARGHFVAVIGLGKVTPAYPAQLAPGSAVVPVDRLLSDSLTDTGKQLVVYWHAWNLCGAVLGPAARVDDYGCVTGAPGTSELVPGAVITCGGPDYIVVCGVDDRVARLDLTTDDGSHIIGTRVKGYGFPRPAFAFLFAAGAKVVVHVDAYDADGHHIAGTAVTAADLR